MVLRKSEAREEPETMMQTKRNPSKVSDEMQMMDRSAVDTSNPRSNKKHSKM
jgi:hypothetical protein